MNLASVIKSESELLLRSVYEAIGSGVLVFNERGIVINANQAAEEILGRPVAELLGMRSSDFNPGVHEDGSPLAQEDRPFPVAVRTRQPLRKMVFGINRPDHQRHWLQVDFTTPSRPRHRAASDKSCAGEC